MKGEGLEPGGEGLLPSVPAVSPGCAAPVPAMGVTSHPGATHTHTHTEVVQRHVGKHSN